jgi:hypothetical protein
VASVHEASLSHLYIIANTPPRSRYVVANVRPLHIDEIHHYVIIPNLSVPWKSHLDEPKRRDLEQKTIGERGKKQVRAGRGGGALLVAGSLGLARVQRLQKQRQTMPDSVTDVRWILGLANPVHRVLSQTKLHSFPSTVDALVSHVYVAEGPQWSDSSANCCQMKVLPSHDSRA